MNISQSARWLAMVSTGFFAGAGHAAPVMRDVPAPQGIVLSGGTIQLDFADPQFGFETADLDRLDEVVWSGGRGQLATTNFVVESGDYPGASDPQNFFGESLGVPTSQSGDLPTDPLVIYKGYASVASQQTTTTLTTTTTGLDFRGNATNVPTASTSYTVYPAGDPNQNEFRVSRTINFTSSTPLYASSGVRFYMPYVSNIFFIVIYPSTDGSIKQVETSKCIVCVIPDWNGQWFADDDDGDGGIMVIRDPSSTAPAQLVIDTEDETLNNLTSIALLQPTDGFTAPVTETEWVCFYDGSTWSYADQRAGNLPQGCSQKNQVIADTTPDAFAFTPVSGVTPNSMQTSNTVTITGINAAAPITVSGGTYSINGGAYTSAAGSVNEGDTVVLQGIASTSYSTETSVTLTVGGVSGAFDVTTEPAPPPSIATVSGHVGGGGALGLGSLCALLLVVLAVRTRSRHGVLAHGVSAPGTSAPGTSARTAALVLGTCVLSSLYASRASAEDPGNSAGPYVGIRAGVSDYQFSPSDLQTRLGPAGSDLDSAAISKRQFGGMLYGGVPLYRNLMLELSYAQLGRFPLSTQTSSADAGALAQRILGQLAPAGHGVTAGFALPLQFGPVFGIEPRLSALYYQSKQVVSLATEVYRNDLRGVGLDAGLSTTWRVAAHWNAGVGLDCFHMTQACNVMTYTAQIEWRFGP